MSNVSTVTQCSQVLNSPFPCSHKQHWNTTLKNCCQIQYLSIYLQNDIICSLEGSKLSKCPTLASLLEIYSRLKIKKKTFCTCWQLLPCTVRWEHETCSRLQNSFSLILILIGRYIMSLHAMPYDARSTHTHIHTHTHTHTHTPRWKINIIEQTTCMQYLVRLEAYI